MIDLLQMGPDRAWVLSHAQSRTAAWAESGPNGSAEELTFKTTQWFCPLTLCNCVFRPRYQVKVMKINLWQSWKSLQVCFTAVSLQTAAARFTVKPTTSPTQATPQEISWRKVCLPLGRNPPPTPRGKINFFFFFFGCVGLCFRNCAPLKMLLFFRFHKETHRKKSKHAESTFCTFVADVCMCLILHGCIMGECSESSGQIWFIKHPTLWKPKLLRWCAGSRHIVTNTDRRIAQQRTFHSSKGQRRTSPWQLVWFTVICDSLGFGILLTKPPLCFCFSLRDRSHLNQK